LPISYSLEATANGIAQRAECRFDKNQVSAEASIESSTISKTLRLEDSTYLLDNNMIDQWAMVCRFLVFEEGKTIALGGFVPQSLASMKITMKVQGKGAIELEGNSVTCFLVDVYPIAEKFWVSEDGILLMIEDRGQNFTVRLVP
jgi:hypothetical protein